jgi:N-acetyl-anhydromuramyl-L-alanine amidase AmpD
MSTAPALITTHPARYLGGDRRVTTHCVWHATSGASATSSLGWLNRPDAVGVAGYHFVIERNGAIYQHTPHDRIAYHAGVSAWPWPDGASLNSRSLGIAFANRQVALGAAGFEVVTEAQIDAAVQLVAWLAETYPALRDPSAHLRHRDCAPTRRSDPTPETLDWPAFVARIAHGGTPVPALPISTSTSSQRMVGRVRDLMADVHALHGRLGALLAELEGGD